MAWTQIRQQVTCCLIGSRPFAKATIVVLSGLRVNNGCFHELYGFYSPSALHHKAVKGNRACLYKLNSFRHNQVILDTDFV